MRNAKLYFTFSRADPSRVMDDALTTGLLPPTAPELVRVQHKEVSIESDLRVLARTAEHLVVSWELDAGFEFSKRHDTLVLSRSPIELTPESALELVAPWSFESCKTSPPKPGWWRDRNPLQGWGLFLKDEGHRLVPQRVIERGPWRLLRHEKRSLTLIQLCDLEAEKEAATEQAIPGQVLLEPVWWGGHFAGSAWAFRSSVGDYKPSFYEPATKTSVILVQDREVSAAEMGIASATRVHQIFEQPVEHVRFVYLDEAMARKQLPELWLRGLEVYAMTAEGERRIDTEYEPPPVEKPAWVKRLDEA